jgi:hypothetical protein
MLYMKPTETLSAIVGSSPRWVIPMLVGTVIAAVVAVLIMAGLIFMKISSGEWALTLIPFTLKKTIDYPLIESGTLQLVGKHATTRSSWGLSFAPEAPTAGDPLVSKTFPEHVPFEPAFACPPTVTVSLYYLDALPEGTPRNMRVRVDATKVKPDGFDIIYSTWGGSGVDGIGANWLAVGHNCTSIPANSAK